MVMKEAIIEIESHTKDLTKKSSVLDYFCIVCVSTLVDFKFFVNSDMLHSVYIPISKMSKEST